MLISVIITAYNYEKYIERCLRSVLDQSLSLKSYEVIVVNDGSTDNTIKLLENYSDLVRVFNLPKNHGLSAARNIGIKKARGQFVVFVDADDYIQHDMLFIQKTFLQENNSLDAVSVDYYLVDERGNHLEHVSAETKPIACGIMFRKDHLIDIGLYDENFLAREEEDLRIRFLKKYSIYNVPLPLYRYRMHDKNLTKDIKKMDEHYLKLKNKHKVILSSINIYLRPICIDDVNESYLEWLNNPVINEGLATKNYTFNKLREYVNLKIKDPLCHFFAIVTNNGNKHIGNIKLDFYDKDANLYELGIMIGDKNYWNKGIGYEACFLMLNYAFDTLNVRKVWLAVYENNPHAKKLYEKLGFVLEGCLRKHICVKGVYYDKYLMGIFREEWEQKRKELSA